MIYTKVKNKLLKLYNKIIEWFKDKKNLNKVKIALLFLIAINFILLSKYISYAYYYQDDSIAFIRSRVGNFYLDDNDVSLLIYIENSYGTKKYHLVESIPSMAYVYSGYKCVNDSNVIYDSENRKVNMNFNQKDVCSVYFDLIASADIKIEYMVETDFSTNEYELINVIPAYGYIYDSYQCTNGSNLVYNEKLHSVKLEASKKESCQLFFKKKQADVVVNLYIESGYKSNRYGLKNTIPTNIEYSLNNEKSICKNGSGKTIYNNITYEKGYVSLVTSEISFCDVYLDVAHE